MPAVDLADIAGVATPFGFGVGSGPTPGTSYGIDLADIASPAPPFSFTVGDVTPPVDLPPTFPHAVRDCLMSSTKIMSALVGGLWWKEAPSRRAGVGWPVAVFSLLNENEDPFTNHGDITHTGLLRFAVSAKSQDVARRIVDRMVQRVTSVELEFDDGSMMELRPSNPTTTGRPERAPGGSLGWTEIRALYFEYTTRLPYPGQPDDLP